MGSTTDIYTHLQSAYIKAAKAVPALQQRFEVAGIDPARIASVNDLSCLPVLKKEKLLDLQRQDPPFGGYLAARYKDLTRIYVSPGPIFEPIRAVGRGTGWIRCLGLRALARTMLC